MFGVLIFASKLAFPTPFDKAMVIVQALMLALGSLLLGRLGATYTALVGGLLTTVIRPLFFPLTLIFAVLYGLLVDGFLTILKVKSSGSVKETRLVLSTTLSTSLIGLISYYFSVFVLQLLPRNLIIEIAILSAGTVSGAIGGWLAVFVWKRGLQKFASS